MRRFYTAIVRHRKAVLCLFAVLAVICALCKQMVSVNYDMNDYLPEDTASTVSLDVMEEEFSGGIPNARVMIHNVSVPEALEYKQKLSEVDGVTDVMWLDDAADVAQPLETLDADTVDTYYKDNTALFTVTMEEHKRVAAVDDIRARIGDDNAMSGTAVSTAVATTSTVSEISKIAAFAVLLVLLILLLTTTSYIEPLVVLIGLGIAIIINAGSNLLFGEISFVTNAAGNILQLAVSLDYSVFLLHRFTECREKAENVEEAMVDALCKSTTSILSSGATTVIGFLALCLMQFRIGPDLGLALAKGIAISLITVFTFSPALILSVYRWIDKTEHRSFMPDFHGFGRFVYRVMLPLVCAFVLIVVPANLASSRNDFYYGSSHIFGPETQLGADTKEMEDIFGKQDTYVVLVPKDSTATQVKLSNELQQLPQVSSMISYVDAAGAEIPTEYLDEDTLSQLISEHYSRLVLTIDADYEGEETFELVQQIRDITNSYYPDSYYLAGEGVSTYDLMTTVTQDMNKVNLVAIAAVFLVLALTMGSVILPVILVICIETAIWINLAIPYFMGSPLFYIAYLIISSIQLGATVDYAILLTDRYQECRRKYDKKTSIVETISAVTVSILTSGITLVIVGFLLGFISTHGLLSQLGILLGRGSLCSIFSVLFVLPGLLYLFDGVIDRKNKRSKLYRRQEQPDEPATN
ncbi:efflux RND transporter permease subunit [Butyricicoccus porcorum]|uniref:efflux RND transporter permease subunit n=1 Tax=Butyricicoccus porcorum TaxID=1945634 RepID=UPI003F4A8CAE